MFRHRLIRELLQHYASAADYDGPLHLTLSHKRYVAAAKRLGYFNTSQKDDLGGALVGKGLIWINPHHKTVSQLADTCAHEVWHLASGIASETDQFLSGVKALVRGRQP